MFLRDVLSYGFVAIALGVHFTRRRLLRRRLLREKLEELERWYNETLSRT
jgi:hypothetical protein